MDEKNRKHPVKKFVSLFIKSDAKSIKEHFIFSIMVPKITELIVDGVRETAEILFYGDSVPQQKAKRSNTYISYNSISSKRNDRRPAVETKPEVNSFHPEADFSFDTYSEAFDKLTMFIEMIDVHANHNLSVKEFLSELGVTSRDYMDDHYGWTNLSTAKVVRRNGLYYLALPRCTEIDRD